jgi:uncharacterized protein
VPNEPTYTAFSGERMIARCGLEAMLLQAKASLDRGEPGPLLIFEDHTGRQIDFDLRGTPQDMLSRLPAHPLFAPEAHEGRPRGGPGRPRLGVVSREVSLLPRHWEWLEQQPNGISAALRRLVDEARKREPGREQARARRDAAVRFMSAMAGNLPGYEEASRALYARDGERLRQHAQSWPADIREHLLALAAESEALEPAQDPPATSD